MLLETHFTSPSNLQLTIDHLLAQAFRRRQGETFVGKEEAPDTVPLLEPFQFFDRPAWVFLPEVLMVQGQCTECAILVVTTAARL